MDEIEAENRFGFDGNWKDYFSIASTNLFLTIVTLGVYRFWAIRREREYLWSNTWFLDEWLEWTGSGKELFIGFIFALLLIGGPLFILQFGVQALASRGHGELALITSICALLFFNFMVGVAKFRALRYRLNRTFWRGLRGGSDEPGWGYGVSNLWKWIANYLSLGSLFAWSTTSLWNDRWNNMQFGNIHFNSKANVKPILKPFLALYSIPLLLTLFYIASLFAGNQKIGNLIFYMDGPIVLTYILYILTFLCIYTGIFILVVTFYATFFHEAMQRLSWNGLHFSFEAKSDHWIRLLLEDFVIILCTLGIGYFFLGYRHWKFFADHLAITGEVDIDKLSQSKANKGGYAESLLDAMDIGAF